MQVVPIQPLLALGVGSFTQVAGSTAVGPAVVISVHVVLPPAVQLPPTVVTVVAEQLLLVASGVQ